MSSVGPTDRTTIPNENLAPRLQALLGYPSPRRVLELLSAYPDATADDWAHVFAKAHTAEVQPDGSVREGWVRAVIESRLRVRRSAATPPDQRYLTGKYGEVIARRLGLAGESEARKGDTPCGDQAMDGPPAERNRARRAGRRPRAGR